MLSAQTALKQSTSVKLHRSRQSVPRNELYCRGNGDTSRTIACFQWRMHVEAEAAVLAALREEERRPMITEEPKTEQTDSKQVEQPRRGGAEILRKLLCGLLTRTRSEQ